MTSLAFRTAGQGPPLLLLHGFSDSGDCWQPVLPALGSGYTAVVVDARGHGNSGLPEEPIDAFRHAEDAAAVLSGLRLSGVTVIGHSMGAITALALAAIRPELVARLVLEDPPVEPMHFDQRMPPWLREMRELGVEGCMDKGRRENPTWDEREFEPWARSKQEFQPRYCELATDDGPGLIELLGRVSCPMLLLAGEHERGGMISEQAAAECRRSAAAPLDFRRVGGAGHSVRRDARSSFLAAVEEL